MSTEKTENINEQEKEVTEATETTEYVTEAPAENESEKKFCAKCGTELTAEQTFCPKCGTKCEADLQPNENIAQFNTQLAENKKKSKKKKLIVLGAIVLAIVLFIGGRAAFIAIRHAVGLSQLTSAVEDYNAGKIEYEEASEKIEKKKESADTDVAAQAVTSEKELDELKKSKDHFQKAETYKAKPDYTNAVLHYSAVIETDTNYEAAQKSVTELIPLWKKTLPGDVDALIKAGKTDEAKKAIDNFLKYSDDADIKNIKKFIEAEDLYKKGHLNNAQNVYKTLPTTLKVNGVTVKSRLDTLKKYSAFVKMCGKWECTSYYKETKEQWDSGRWYNWYNDGDGKGNSDTLTVTCVINKDGTVTVSGVVTYWMYTNYSSVSAYVNRDTFTADFRVKVKLSQGNNLSFKFSEGTFTRGGSHVDDTQSISFNGKTFTHTCKVVYHYSRSCDEIYSSRDTFGKRTEKY